MVTSFLVNYLVGWARDVADPKDGKRGPGRPRINPVDGARRNVTMQVSLDLYDRLKSTADGAGLSIGRQMEALIEKGLSTAPQDIAHAAAAAAVEAAVTAVSDQHNKEFQEQFGGSCGLLVGKFFYDVLMSELAKRITNIDSHDKFMSSANLQRDFVTDVQGRVPEITDIFLRFVALGFFAKSVDLNQLTEAIKKNSAEDLSRVRTKINDKYSPIKNLIHKKKEQEYD